MTTILPMWRGITDTSERLTAAKTFISQRQIDRLYVVGSNDTTAPVIEDGYRRFLAVFDSATVDGRPWTQPVFPYQGKCLQWIRREFAGLEAADRQAVLELLRDTGCEPLLEAPA